MSVIIAGCDVIGISHLKVQGIAINPGTGKGVEGVEVFLYEDIPDGNSSWSIWGGSGGGHGDVVKTTVTDKDGFFGFEYTGEKNSNYSISGIKENYSLGEEVGPIRLLDGQDYNLFVLELIPDAWIKLHVKNIKSVEDQYLEVISIYDFAFNTINLYGHDIDTILCCDYAKGDQYKNIKYGLWQNVVDYPVNVIDTMIYTPAFDTTFVEIMY